MKTKKTAQTVSSNKTTEATAPTPANPMQGANVSLAPDFKTVYTNFIQGQFSPFDMSFMIGEALGPGPDGKQMILEHLRIIMAPMEAKIFLMIIANGLKRYEEQFGKISVPPELMPHSQQ
jgi:hypothetical protein